MNSYDSFQESFIQSQPCGDAPFRPWKFLCLIFCVLLLSTLTYRVYNAVVFNIHCGGYMGRAAHANTVELATVALEKAVKYARSKDLTKGNTGILWETPDNDVGFWYTNLEASLTELRSIRPDSSSLEKSNVLMKLRETLTDHSKEDSVRCPDGISIYPHNVVAFILLWVGLLGSLATGLKIGFDTL